MNEDKMLLGIDLFAGAGGLTLGAKQVGINVISAVENDHFAAESYRLNHPEVKMFETSIFKVSGLDLIKENADRMNHEIILFGGPPCQGYSTSNQKTRNKDNEKNWLFEEFVRITKEISPEWIVFENVKGLVETEKGFFHDVIVKSFEQLGYICTELFPFASDYGIPQRRNRYFLTGSKKGLRPVLPDKHERTITVREAFEDLPFLSNGAMQDVLPYGKEALSDYARLLRGELDECSGHLVSKNADYVIQRYSYIPQGGNWVNIPDELMQNYKNKDRCHTGVYKRLREDEPAMTVGNYRKSMLIHPWQDRGLSVREAARLQSFPDSYKFYGSIGYQQQQVGNAVPPLLAKIIFEAVKDAK